MKKVVEFTMYIVVIFCSFYEIFTQTNNSYRSLALIVLLIFLIVTLQRATTIMRQSRGGQSSPWTDD